MTYYDQMLETLRQKQSERLGRAKALSGVAKELTEYEAKELIEKQLCELQTWTTDQLINEFVDHEELMIRGVLERISLKM